jgi:hypothetical protein
MPPQLPARTAYGTGTRHSAAWRAARHLVGDFTPMPWSALGNQVELARLCSTADNGAFSGISASWVVPTRHCSSGRQYSRFWVSLDEYSGSTVDQTRSGVDYSRLTPVHCAWGNVPRTLAQSPPSGGASFSAT